MQQNSARNIDSPVRHSPAAFENDAYRAIWFRVAALLGTFYVLGKVLSEVARLPSESYREPVLVVELLKRASLSSSVGPVGPVVLVVGLGFLIWRFRRRLFSTWEDLGAPRSIRVVIVLVAVLVAWSYATYDTNLYFGQLHATDRVLCLLLVGSVAWRPIFLAPFLVVLLGVVGQFSTPLPGFSPAELKLLINILTLFLAFVLIRTFTDRIRLHDFAFLMFVMLASSYWVGGVGKLRLGWVTHGHMERLIVATYANGWLGFLDADAVVSFARSVARIDWVLRFLTLVAELGALVALWRRSTLLTWLVLWAGFHVGVVVVTGIFFWKWLLLDMVLFVIVWKHSRPLKFFSRPHFLMAAVLILFSALWLQPTDLSWFNSRITYTYRFVATGESGEQYSLSPQFFAPYDYQFTVGLFQYLTDHPLLPVAWGATDVRRVADAEVDPQDPAGLVAVEAELGRDFFDAAKQEVFEGFVHDFVSEFNRRGTKSDWFSRLAPLPQLLTSDRDDAFRGQEQLVHVTVLLITSQFDDITYAEVRTEVLLEVEIVNGANDDVVEE